MKRGVGGEGGKEEDGGWGGGCCHLLEFGPGSCERQRPPAAGSAGCERPAYADGARQPDAPLCWGWDGGEGVCIKERKKGGGREYDPTEPNPTVAFAVETFRTPRQSHASTSNMEIIENKCVG